MPKMPKTKPAFVRYLGNELAKSESPQSLKFGQYLILGQCLGFICGDVEPSEVTSARVAMFDLRDPLH